MKLFAKADTGLAKKTIAIYREEIRTDRKRFILTCIFAPMQGMLLNIIIPLIISFFTQSLITNPKDTTTALWLVAGVVIISVLTLIVSRIGFISLFHHQEYMQTRLAERAMRGLLAHSYAFFANNKVGSLSGDVASFARSYSAVTENIFFQASGPIINFVVSLIIIAFIAPIMLPVLLILTILVFGEAIYSYNRRGKFRAIRKEMMSRLFGLFADSLGNHTLVRMFGRSDYEVGLTVKQRKDIEEVARKEILEIQNSSQRRVSILSIFQVMTLLISMYLVSESLLSIAAFIFIITYLGRVSGSMLGLTGIIRMLEQAFLDSAKVTEILDKTPEVLDAPNAKKLDVTKGKIVFTNVDFAYEEAKKQIVFKDFNLTIESGQSVGLVGRSGGGKSTLSHLLLRYMDIKKGKITIDGQNIAEVTQDSLRRSIAFVPQDPFLFHRSLRDNIAYGKPDASDDEVRAAAKKAHALEFIDKLPDGFDTIVGERGVKLSGGQRQRIAIARAILKDAPILVLDEATSALDSESEVLIQKSLEALMKDRTSIVIAHRLSTIAKLDRIIVLDNGRIAEDNSHKHLLEKGNIYAKLWKHQSGGFIEE